ncbi:hypothetical protein JW948_06590 [bacterium]|nr:hypothetical protein [bacterium]
MKTAVQKLISPGLILQMILSGYVIYGHQHNEHALKRAGHVPDRTTVCQCKDHCCTESPVSTEKDNHHTCSRFCSCRINFEFIIPDPVSTHQFNHSYAPESDNSLYKFHLSVRVDRPPRIL